MRQAKAFLKGKLTQFQQEIAQLNHALQNQKSSFQEKEEEIYKELFEILDIFERLENSLQDKENKLDKTFQSYVKSNRILHKKLMRFLKSRNIVQIEFPENRAKMDYCKVTDTQEAANLENETILSVVKNGYIDNQRNITLRKAEVITVLNANIKT